MSTFRLATTFALPNSVIVLQPIQYFGMHFPKPINDLVGKPISVGMLL
jgi:hypothetical protein